ncbi:MAG: type VI secretion system ATPase TssH [Fibrobacterales bacterium]
MISASIKNILEKLNTLSKKNLEGALGACVTRGHYEITTMHFIAQCLEDSSGDLMEILDFFKVDPNLFRKALNEELKEYQSGNSGKPVFSPSFLSTLELAWSEATLNLNCLEIRTGSVVVALRKNMNLVPEGLQDYFKLIQAETLVNQFGEIVAASREGQATKHSTSKDDNISEDSFLGTYTEDFVAFAKTGKIDPIFGRDDEIRQTIDILSRRRKNNPIFIGEAGVGKTAVVEGLALKIAEGDVPDALKDVELRSLDMGTLSAGAGVRGEFENRLKGIINEIKESDKHIILFIDEAHTMIGAGGEAGKNDAANLLKPELARGDLKCIAATTFTEFRKYFEKDPAIARRFQAVTIAEPDPESAAIMLRGLREKYEDFHGVKISYEAVKAACEFSNKFIAGRQLPDKAVDLLDTATARVKMGLKTKPAALQNLEQSISNLQIEIKTLEKDLNAGILLDETQLTDAKGRFENAQTVAATLTNEWSKELEQVNAIIAFEEKVQAASDADKPALRAELKELWKALEEIQNEKPLVHAHVTPAVVAQIIEEWTGIPAGNMMKSEAATLLELGETINRRVIGQPWGVAEISNTIRSGKMGLTKAEAPMGVFLVTGPSGVGKTEVARTIADLMFGGERSVVTINMSEYQDSMSVTQLKGASAGYVGYGDGGILTEGVRKNPYTVVILDEVEKAHKDVLNMFYQVFDQGILRDGEGRDINFRNTVILMTSNLGTDTICNMAVDEENDYEYGEYSEAIVDELTAHFAPALLARCKVVPFLPLGYDSLQKIIAIKLNKVANTLMNTHGVTLAVSPKIIEKVVNQCTLMQSGARNIDTILDQQILPEISKNLLINVADEKVVTHLFISVDDEGHYQFYFSEGDFDAPELNENIEEVENEIELTSEESSEAEPDAVSEETTDAQ